LKLPREKKAGTHGQVQNFRPALSDRLTFGFDHYLWPRGAKRFLSFFNVSSGLFSFAFTVERTTMSLCGNSSPGDSGNSDFSP